MVARAAEVLTQRMQAREDATARAAAEAAAAPLADTDSLEYVRLPRRQLLAGGGSAAATGMQQRLGENRSAALSAEPEIEQILTWFTAEGGIDKGVVGKLWDSVAWHRPAMDKRRAITVPNLWWGFIAGGHV